MCGSKFKYLLGSGLKSLDSITGVLQIKKATVIGFSTGLYLKPKTNDVSTAIEVEDIAASKKNIKKFCNYFDLHFKC